MYKRQQDGCAVLTQAKWFEVTEQMRSKDVEHDILLSKMYKGNTVTVTDLQIYKPLDKDDFEDDDNPWLFAPILVLSLLPIFHPTIPF